MIGKMKNIMLKRWIHKCFCKYFSTLPKSTQRDEWQAVIGLEIHAQISSSSKLFSRASTKYGAPPNTQVTIFESAHPGTLPVLNRRCVEAAVKTALAMNATINKISWFDRKHYFYPDLPAGYQITQAQFPVASNGMLDFLVYNPAVHTIPYRRTVDLIQLQLEEDSGKSIHEEDCNRVLVDLNRAGQPLMELVFGPQLHSGEEAAALVKEVGLILTTLGTCNCYMNEGALRVDANVSLHRPGEPLGTRTEVKNINSIRSLAKAVDFEVERQLTVLEAGGCVKNETRSFNTVTRQTECMRDKEIVQDYRFMPEPNLPPLCLYDSLEPDSDLQGSFDIHEIRCSMPDLPETVRQRLMRDYSISLASAVIFVNDKDLLNYFLAVMSKEHRSSKLVTNLLLTDLLGALNATNTHITHSRLGWSAFGEIVDMQQIGLITLSTSQAIINVICIDGDTRTPAQIVTENNWTQICEESKIEEIVDKVLLDNPEMVGRYRQKKKTKFLNALMGKIKLAGRNRINMAIVSKILNKKLSS